MKDASHPFGVAIGLVSLLLAIAAPLVALVPPARSPLLIIPALLGAMVALLCGAWPPA